VQPAVALAADPDGVGDVVPEHGQVAGEALRLQLQLLQQPALRRDAAHRQRHERQRREPVRERRVGAVVFVGRRRPVRVLVVVAASVGQRAGRRHGQESDGAQHGVCLSAGTLSGCARCFAAPLLLPRIIARMALETLVLRQLCARRRCVCSTCGVLHSRGHAPKGTRRCYIIFRILRRRGHSALGEPDVGEHCRYPRRRRERRPALSKKAESVTMMALSWAGVLAPPILAWCISCYFDVALHRRAHTGRSSRFWPVWTSTRCTWGTTRWSTR